MEEPRWNIITASQYEWERAAFDFIRQGLPDHDPYRAWANFEFHTPDGAIYEVDLLVLTKQGFFLVEIKSWPGRVRGDASNWTRIKPDGKSITEDNPVMLANRKSKALSSLLKVHTAKKVRVPWLDPIVFLSSDDLICDLSGPARNKVVLKDREATDDRKARKGILAALINRDAPGIDPTNRSTIDSKVSKALARAFEKAPEIQKSRRSRRVGDYLLTDLISEGPGYQDRLAKRVSMEDDFCRIRQYTVAGASNEDERQKRKRAAEREYRILKSLHHPNILPVLDYKDDERGPALLFRYPDPNAIRFDHYLATHCHKLTSDQRLDMLRQVADAIRYAHRKRVVHRALGPQSILVMRDEGGRMKLEAERNADQVKEDGPEYGTSPFDDPSQLYLQVFNWQVGVRESATSSGGATNVDDLIDTSSLVYMSPEATADPNKVTEASDIFSLGAIAYHLFSSRPPAGSAAELSKILRENKGLSISSVLDGAGPKLEEFIQWSTHPDVSTRVGSVEDFLLLLDGDDGVVDELTAPDEKLITDPLDAGRGDRLEHGFTVERELGQGATAKALLVSKDGEQSVLKIALTDDDNIRLEGEAEALASIQSEFVVKLLDKHEMNGRIVLELQKAGDKTLAAELRSEGVPPLEMLGRYGDDLMSAVASLERHGVVHRDLKPDNIGIRSLTSKRNQLILFDFSLALSSLDNIRVGTPGYGDPFLVNRKPQRWDLAAERYSAGVTLYEMSMGAGALPQWGDGQSDPAYTEDELVIDAEKFEPSVREGLVEFFLTALHRDPKKRFDNAEEMRWSWNEVFKDAEKRKVTTSTGEEVDLSVSLDQVDLETPIAALPLSTKARNALERADVLTVKGLLNYPVNSIYMMRRVGNQTRQEIIRFVTELRKRFPDIEVVTKRITTQTDDEFGTPNLELLHQKVVGTRNSKKETEWKIRCGLLGITAPEDQSVDQWPSQADVADAREITRGRVGQVLSADRKRWAKDSTLNSLRTDLCEQIERLGGVVTIAELIEVTLLLRPANDPLDSARQQRMASAIARAAVETESSVVDPRFQLRRIGGKTVISITQELAAYAGKLGEVADELAKTDPLPPQLRVFQELYEVTQPPSPPRCQPLSNERLIKLAAAMSSEAAVSSRQELYPIGMSAERALRLGIGALTGLGLGDDKQVFSVDQVRTRIRKRYPKALPLPDRPELDAMLQRVGLEVVWDSDRKAYRRRRGESMFTSGSSVPRRQSTATSTRVVEITEDVAEARQMEERLQHAYDDGGFLVLTVTPSEMRACEYEVTHRFDFQKVSFDDLLIDHLRVEAEELEVDWNIVQKADAAAKSSQDWTNLSQLVSRVIPKIEKQLLGSDQPTLLVHPGLIARYDQMILLEHLRDNVGHDDACPCLWVLVATDEQNDMPLLDGAEIPLISSSQRTKVSEAWINNRHRGRGNQVATAENTTGMDGA